MIAEVEKGAEIVITRHRRPVARLSPVGRPPGPGTVSAAAVRRYWRDRPLPPDQHRQLPENHRRVCYSDSPLPEPHSSFPEKHPLFPEIQALFPDFHPSVGVRHPLAARGTRHSLIFTRGRLREGVRA